MAQQPSSTPEAGSNQKFGGEEAPLKVEIYTWRFCPYCIRAKGLLDRKGVIYNEYMIDGDETARQAMIRRAEGRSTLPQIFINNRAIGGCDDLMELDRTGWLNQFLGIEA
jgi:glutaredoxin 3